MPRNMVTRSSRKSDVKTYRKRIYFRLQISSWWNLGLLVMLSSGERERMQHDQHGSRGVHVDMPRIMGIMGIMGTR